MTNLSVELNQYCFNRSGCKNCPFDFGGRDGYFCVMDEITEKLNIEKINQIFGFKGIKK